MLKLFLILQLSFLTLYSSQKIFPNPVFSENQSIILRTVMSPDGYIDKQLYDSFWGDFNNLEMNENSKRLLYSNKTMIIVKDIQYENYLCAKLSIKNHKIVKTKKLFDLYKEAEEYGVDLEMTKKNTDIFLNASANKEPIEMNGQMIYITEEFVNNVLSNLAGSMERFKLLMATTWKGNN